jgi:hypothetical protein
MFGIMQTVMASTILNGDGEESPDGWTRRAIVECEGFEAVVALYCVV